MNGVAEMYSIVDKLDIREDGTIYRLDGSLAAQNLIGSKSKYFAIKAFGKQHAVHRLVAMKYIPNPNDLPQVNHKDEDKTNNHVSNLEWCTHQYNKEYSDGKPLAITKDGEVLEFKSRSSAARYLGASVGNLGDLCNGRLESVKGWRLVS